MNARPSFVALWQSIFVLALLLELPVVALAAPAGKKIRATLASALGNAITHPALWFLWPRVFTGSMSLYVGEGFAILVEGALMTKLGRLGPRAGFGIAAAVNLWSWAIGELVVRVIAVRLMAYWYGAH